MYLRDVGRLLTGEHALELVRVLETARLLELRYHARLRLVGCRYAVNETLRELGRVVLLEDVLVVKILEKHHLGIIVKRYAYTPRG